MAEKKQEAETEEVSRQLNPERGTRPQPEREVRPDYYERSQERSGGRGR